MGTLLIVSTPIGNLEDITVRALSVLAKAKIIACEDTRQTGQLLTLLRERFSTIIPFPQDEKPLLISYYEEKEQQIAPELVERLLNGDDIVLVSDAGTPLISDPGYRVVSESVKREIPIVVVPGVTAFVTALTGSGLPQNAITFLGYLPEKQEKRLQTLTHIKASHAYIPATYAMYVSPHKIEQTLLDMETVFGDISIVLGRELTKIHEEYIRGTVSEIRSRGALLKGELVLLFTLK